MDASQSEIPLEVAIGLKRSEYETACKTRQWKGMYKVLECSMPGLFQRNYDLLNIIIATYEGNENPNDYDIPDERWLDCIAADVMIEQGAVAFSSSHPLYISSNNLVSKFRSLTLDATPIETYLPHFIGSLDGESIIFSVHPITHNLVSSATVDYDSALMSSRPDLVEGDQTPLKTSLQKRVDRFMQLWRGCRSSTSLQRKTFYGGSVICRLIDDLLKVSIDIGKDSNDLGPKSLAARSRLTIEFQVSYKSNTITDMDGKSVIFTTNFFSKVAYCHDGTSTSGSSTGSDLVKMKFQSEADLMEKTAELIGKKVFEMELKLFDDIEQFRLPDFRLLRPVSGYSSLSAGYRLSKEPLAVHNPILKEAQEELFDKIKERCEYRPDNEDHKFIL